MCLCRCASFLLSLLFCSSPVFQSESDVSLKSGWQNIKADGLKLIPPTFFFFCFFFGNNRCVWVLTIFFVLVTSVPVKIALFCSCLCLSKWDCANFPWNNLKIAYMQIVFTLWACIDSTCVHMCLGLYLVFSSYSSYSTPCLNLCPPCTVKHLELVAIKHFLTSLYIYDYLGGTFRASACQQLISGNAGKWSSLIQHPVTFSTLTPPSTLMSHICKVWDEKVSSLFTSTWQLLGDTNSWWKVELEMRK